ncbi:DNA polymerase zeta [Mortierella claussenii]|nr:DNA polymerase zeta [Mortierella claussenii]
MSTAPLSSSKVADRSVRWSHDTIRSPEDESFQHHSMDREHGKNPDDEVTTEGELPVPPPPSRPVRFKIRVADLDYYMAEPGPLDLDICPFLPPNCPVLKVPVIRVYGANESGQKTCLHVHRVFPYFYVPYEGALELSQLQSYINQLALSLNHAACITFNTPQNPWKSQYVAAITPIKGVPFYGYHVGYSYFLKIYLFNPDFESRIVELMRSGAIMGTKFQPFEAHIPFKLQFFIDYNLYGMGWLELEEGLLRNDVPGMTIFYMIDSIQFSVPVRHLILVVSSLVDPMEGDHPKRLTKATVEDTHVWSHENDPGRKSHCEIEMDSKADRIVNRDRAAERNTHTTLDECFQPPSLTAQVPSMASLWEDDARRRKANNMPFQELPKTQIRDPVSIPWLNHDMNKQMVADLVHQMVSLSHAKMPTQGDFDNYRIDEDPISKNLMTAYESVEFLCPCESSNTDAEDPLESRSQGLQDISFVYDEADSSILVDESILSQAAGAFEEDDMDTRKEIFKGLTGLEGIGEEDEDDNFPLPDMDDDFQDEDFMDEADLWDEMEPSDAAPQEDLMAQGPSPVADNRIPQFDGGGDEDVELPKNGIGKHEDSVGEWRSMTKDARKKRERSSSSSLLVSNDRIAGKQKRFCTIVAATHSENHAIHPVPSLQHPNHAPSSRPTTVMDDLHAAKQPQGRHISTVRSHLRTPPRSAHELQSAPSPQKPSRLFMQFVQIPSHPRRKHNLNASENPSKRATLTGINRPVPKLVTTISDDPIVDDDDGHSKEEIEPLFQELHADEYHSRLQSRAARQSHHSSPLSTLKYQYPEPASPGRNYFLSSMDEMWSSPSPPLEKSAFLFSPPRPTSPDLIPARTIPLSPSVVPSEPTNTYQETVVPAVTISPDLDMTRGAGPSRKNSSVVNQSFIDEPFMTQDEMSDAGDDEYKGCPKQRDQINDIVLAEDSIIDDSFESGTLQRPEESCASLSAKSTVSGLTPHTYQFSFSAPTTTDLLATFQDLGLSNIVHQKPYFSNEADVPSRLKVFGGKEFRLQSNGINTMPIFKGNHSIDQQVTPGNGFLFWEPIMIPPTQIDIREWLEEEGRRQKASLRSAGNPSTQKRQEKISQIEGPTQKNPFGYKNSPTKVAASIAVEKDFLDVMSLEIHCQTRGNLLPDPKVDPVLAVFYCWQTDREGLISNGWVPGYRVGIFTHAEAGMMRKLAIGRVGFDIHVADNEGDMMHAVLQHVLMLDPDILAGYEIHKLSWGYLIDRFQVLFGLDLSKLLSRVRPLKAPLLSKSAIEARDSYNTKHHSGLKIAGRHLFNVWRLIRGEVALTNYGFCNVVFHVLQQRVPHYTHETLTKWWTSNVAVHQSRVVRNYLHRVQYTLQLIESQELVSRTSEFARVFGVDFFSVISRGSQYKVESMMVRLAKPENYIMISPSRAQVAAQRALEVIPMVMEPESGFYEDPVVVLDFQSLYPSVMTAYNICYSTCLGKLGGGTKLGVLTDYNIREGVLPLVEEHLHVAPNNVMYVNQDIRRGLLGRMLAELLDTRVMIKKAMKEYPNNKSLLKLLDARQLSLKFIANVTYGYTSASFSGRMPGIEIADSIVLSGRETLERAIRFVNEHPKWNAKVVYGDTDSMFVHLKGRTRQEAFEIGYDISETITRMNPRPVKLKFEKVYDGCFLVTKKRYVGNAYETPSQKEGIFDAKGIETIRRDGIPAVQKIMETCIKTMFKTKDLSLVKTYLVRQLGKILEGRAPVPDLMFGKEVRMGGYSEKSVPPPGAVVSARRMELDPRAEPQHGERVPYVVVYGDPGARLTDQVVEPRELLRNKDLRLNAEYYIRKHVIPSMERIFQLAGADVKSWFEEMPRIQKAIPLTLSLGPGMGMGGGGGGVGVGSSTAATVIPTMATSAAVAAQQQQQQQQQQDQQQSNHPNQQQEQGTSSTDSPNPISNPYEHLAGPPRFKPKRRGGKGFVSVGSRIDRYYQSQLCTICGGGGGTFGQKMNGNSTSSSNYYRSHQKDLCADCLSDERRVHSMLVMQQRLTRAEKLFRATVDVCSSCCRGASQGGIGVGIATLPSSSMDEGTRGVEGDDDNELEGREGGETTGGSMTNTGTEVVACESLECNVFWLRRRAQDALQITHSVAERVMEELEAVDLSF